MTEPGGSQGEGADAALLRAADRSLPAEVPAQIGVAVSGGSDSVALLHLFSRIAAFRGFGLRAVTVDHRLRPEAADEARGVADLCQRLGVAHDTLVWDHGPVCGNLQDQARRARYGLIAAWARQKAIGHVMLGHTADDQAETFLMGLGRAAGLDGLSGMRPTWEQEGVLWLRPLLSTSRAALRAYLGRNGLAWAEDPSNANELFTRIKARKALKALAPLGITAASLGTVTANLVLARQALVAATAAAAQEVARTEAGQVILDRDGVAALPPDIRRRLLIGALRWVARQDYAPRADAIQRLSEAVMAGRDATLAGCRFTAAGAAVRVLRELRAVRDLEGPTDALWDGRWRLSGPQDAGLTVRALGAEGLLRCPGWRDTGHGRAALLVTPAIWRGAELVAAPLAGRGGGWAAEIHPDLHSFLITH